MVVGEKIDLYNGGQIATLAYKYIIGVILTLPRGVGPRSIQAPSDVRPISHSSRNPYPPLEIPQGST